jgi:hypothetical protein
MRTFTATALVLGALTLGAAASAHADPIVPGMQTNCETGFGGTLWCDGPIRPAGT